MTIDDLGFFSPDMKIMSENIEREHKSFFDLAYLTNGIAQKAKFDFKPVHDNPQQNYAVALFIRVLTSFQSVVLLYKQGLSVEARGIARHTLEAFFLLKHICENVNFSDAFYRDTLAKQLKIINVALNEIKPDDQAMLDQISQNKVDLEAFGIKNSDAFSAQQLIGDFYVIFRVLSDYVHVSEWLVIKALPIETGGDFIEWGPNTDDLKQTLVLVNEIVYRSIVLMSTLFQVDKSAELQEIENALAPLRGTKK